MVNLWVTAAVTYLKMEELTVKTSVVSLSPAKLQLMESDVQKISANYGTSVTVNLNEQHILGGILSLNH